MKKLKFWFVFPAFALSLLFGGKLIAQEKERWFNPEVTAKLNLGIYHGGYAFSLGTRIDEKRTIGFALAMYNYYYDAYPSSAQCLSPNIYARRYFHLGEKQIVSFYADAMLGASVVIDGSSYESLPQKGDVRFNAGIEPGIRVRLFRNAHIFLGPSIGTSIRGVHIGIGL